MTTEMTTEYVLKTQIPPPDGFEYTGEFRPVRFGEWYLSGRKACQRCVSITPSKNAFAVLRRAHWVPKRGEEYWFARWEGVDHNTNDEMPCDLCRQEERNQWCTQEQAAVYSKARRELALRLHEESEE